MGRDDDFDTSDPDRAQAGRADDRPDPETADSEPKKGLRGRLREIFGTGSLTGGSVTGGAGGTGGLGSGAGDMSGGPYTGGDVMTGGDDGVDTTGYGATGGSDEGPTHGDRSRDAEDRARDAEDSGTDSEAR